MPFFWSARALIGVGALSAAAAAGACGSSDPAAGTGGSSSSSESSSSASSSAMSSASSVSSSSTGGSGGSAPMGLHVEGNRLVDGGNPILLRGVNHSGTEYACVQSLGIFDGPNDDSAIMAMKTWHINVVRVPLNESCWLGINGVDPSMSGPAYQAGIADYVKRLRAQDLYVILDLHWSAPGAHMAMHQDPMIDADHGIDLWKSVAMAFSADSGVIFDLYNEPYVDDWPTWLNGGMQSKYEGQMETWQTAGMQALVDAVRGTGATNVLMLGGLAYSNDLSGWLAHQPDDPLKNLTASMHLYNFNVCKDAGCWDSAAKPTAAMVPLVTGEIGENDCTHDFVDGYMTYADMLGISYLGWTWNDWDCGNGPALIKDYTGAPTPFGDGIRTHFLAVNP